MRYLYYLSLCSLIIALASCRVQDIDIGDGLVLEVSHRISKTIRDNTRCEELRNAIERGLIPDTLETQTETVIVQEGFMDAVVTPIIYNSDGTVKTPAKVKLLITPAVSKQVRYPVVKIPSREVQRKSNAKCKPMSRRIISKPKSYKIKDKSGATIHHFETAEALVEYINSK